MLRAPRIIWWATIARLRSRINALLTARSRAKVHDRCIRGTTLRRFLLAARKRPRPTPAVRRALVRGEPAGGGAERGTPRPGSRGTRPTVTLLLLLILH